MKTKTYLIILIAIFAASCTSLQQSTVNDDIYYSPKDQVAFVNEVNTSALRSNNSSTIFGNTYDDQIADILEDESIQDTLVYDSGNSYNDLVVDDYSDAMVKRRNATKSLYYGTNNYFITTTDAYRYAEIYANDPYYNIVIIGDQVWVEPYYITASLGYGYCSSYYYDPFYYSYYSPYYSSYYYRPFYRSFYHPYYYDSYYSYYNPYKSFHSVKNDNYASSSFHSYRQRTLSSRSVTRSSVERTSRGLPETYAGRDISRSSSVKSGLDRQSVRTERTTVSTTRTRSADATTPRVITESSRTRTATSANRNYTRPQSTSRSTYNATTRSTSRYKRPASSNANSGRSQGVSRSTYTPNKNASSNSRSGSSYAPRKSGSSSSGNSSGRSSVRSSSSRSSGSSNRSSVKSSGSSSRSSGSSNRSSGSSSKSSSSSTRSGGKRR